MNRLTLACMTALLAVPGHALAAKSNPAAPIVLPTPKPGKGQVVFFRPGGMGTAIKCTLRENGKMVGRVGNKRYYVIDAEPGVHSFTAKSEKTDEVTVQVEPDETSFVKCKIAMGMMVGRPNLSPSTAMEFAGETKLEAMESAKVLAEIAKDQGKAGGDAGASN